MKRSQFLSLTSAAVILLGSLALSANATPVNLTLQCGPNIFSLTADRIYATLGASDTGSFDVDQVLKVGTKCSTTQTPLTATLLFNTTQPSITLQMDLAVTVVPSVPTIPGSWNVTALTVDINNFQKETFTWSVPFAQLQQIDWLNSGDRAKGKKCSYGEVDLNSKNKLGWDNVRFFPVSATAGQAFNNDNYNLCAADLSGGVGGLSWWAWLLIIVGVLVVLGGLGFGGFVLFQRRR